MKKTVFSLIFCSMAMGAFAQQPLGGFLYGTEVAPMGTEWEAPEKLSLNKEQPHAYFFSFNDVESALKVLPQHSRSIGHRIRMNVRKAFMKPVSM